MQMVQNALACRGAGLIDLVSALACRCSEEHQECPPVEAYQMLLRTRACVAVRPPAYTLGENGETIQVMDWTFSPPCANLVVEQVDAKLFERKYECRSIFHLWPVHVVKRLFALPNTVSSFAQVAAGGLVAAARSDGTLVARGGYQLGRNYRGCLGWQWPEDIPQRHQCTAIYSPFVVASSDASCQISIRVNVCLAFSIDDSKRKYDVKDFALYVLKLHS